MYIECFNLLKVLRYSIGNMGTKQRTRYCFDQNMPGQKKQNLIMVFEYMQF